MENRPMCCDRPMSKDGKYRGYQVYTCPVCGSRKCDKPPTKSRRKYASNAERQRAYRERRSKLQD